MSSHKSLLKFDPLYAYILNIYRLGLFEEKKAIHDLHGP